MMKRRGLWLSLRCMNSQQDESLSWNKMLENFKIVYAGIYSQLGRWGAGIVRYIFLNLIKRWVNFLLKILL